MPVLCLLGLLPGARAAAVERELVAHGSFRFSYPQGMRPAVRELAAAGEAALTRIAADLGTPGVTPIEIRVARDLEEFARMQPPGVRVPSWAVGTAHSRYNLIVLNLGRTASGTLADSHRVLAHELSHLLLAQAVGGHKVPRWFNEGLAVRAGREWSFWRGRALVGPALTGTLIPLRKLDLGFPVEEQSAQLAYAQSVEFVAWLIEEHGAAKLQQVIALLRGGQPFFDALQEATGRRLEDLEQEWISHLKMRFNWLPLLTSSAVIWFLGAIVFLMAYGRRRVQRRRRLDAMGAEEAALERVITVADQAEKRAGAAEDFDDRGPPPGSTVH